MTDHRQVGKVLVPFHMIESRNSRIRTHHLMNPNFLLDKLGTGSTRRLLDDLDGDVSVVFKIFG